MHLIDATIKTLYHCTNNWDGSLYCGISTLKWDFLTRTAGLSMASHIATTIHKFQHPLPTWPEYSSCPWNKPVFGQSTQQPFPEDSLGHFFSQDILRMHQIIGTLLFYAQAVLMTQLAALNYIASEQPKGTKNIATAILQDLKYCATHPHATICYHISEMILHIKSDASYWSMPTALGIINNSGKFLHLEIGMCPV
jgi:hypothetical protein